MLENEFYKEITEKVICIVKEVANYIMDESKKFSMENVITKNRNEFVSYVDIEAEIKLTHSLSGVFPSAGFITEEGTYYDNAKEYCWIIDPLDGTTNFIHGSTPYAISVGLTYQGIPVVGVIHEITRNETFYAWKGSKAYLNEYEIRVSKIENLKDSLISTGRPHNYMTQYDKLLKSISHFLRNSHGIRQSGSAAADLAYVACGRYDGRYEFGLKSWDIAAGVLIVKQAGGRVSDFEGNENYFENGNVLVSNPYIFDELKNVVATIFER